MLEIRRLNDLDIQLYEYAMSLFIQLKKQFSIA